VDIAATAQQIADEVLFPAALTTDTSDVVSRDLLDTLASAGLYGLAAPADAGGPGVDLATACAVQETLASGCLTTAFVWVQHHGLVRALTAAGNEGLAATWLAPLVRGQVRAGLGGGGMLPQPTLRAERNPHGWVLDGVSPFVSGWGRIDVIHVAARAGDGDIVWLIVDAAEGPSLRAERLRLAALNATATVRLTFDRLPVAADRMTAKHPPANYAAPEVLRVHSALALGVAARCCRLLGPSPLDSELALLRDELNQLGPGITTARAAAGELALRAAAALMTAEGSRSLLADGYPQLLAREAMFVLVYALRPASREALLTRLGAGHRR
jgi:alkylation response protein AidB-like acyl-CoA dehydrogenase